MTRSERKAAADARRVEIANMMEEKIMWYIANGHTPREAIVKTDLELQEIIRKDIQNRQLYIDAARILESRYKE